jgi:hypothetical protein
VAHRAGKRRHELFLLKDGVRYAIAGEPIDDDELATYAEGDPIGGAPPPPDEAAAPPTNTATGAKKSAAGVATPQPANPAPPAIAPQFVSIQSNAPGQTATIILQATQGQLCTLAFAGPGPTRGAGSNVGQQTVDASGAATISFQIDPATPTGRGKVTATCGRTTISSPIDIGSPVSR